MNRIELNRERVLSLTRKKQTVTAKQIDMTPPTFRRKLWGESTWTLDEINRLADVLEINATDLIKAVDTTEATPSIFSRS